ncbi:hypothetical protein GJ496_002563 [Pomphorhynchus laevis]|nr:hypothetical protein GJ496_002563 [Pomphorhynchus laevis]
MYNGNSGNFMYHYGLSPYQRQSRQCRSNPIVHSYTVMLPARQPLFGGTRVISVPPNGETMHSRPNGLNKHYNMHRLPHNL